MTSHHQPKGGDGRSFPVSSEVMVVLGPLSEENLDHSRALRKRARVNNIVFPLFPYTNIPSIFSMCILIYLGLFNVLSRCTLIYLGY